MSTETKELRSQVLQLKQERAIYEMKVEQTFSHRVKNGVEAGVKARLKVEDEGHARRMDEYALQQAIAAKGKEAEPLDIVRGRRMPSVATCWASTPFTDRHTASVARVPVQVEKFSASCYFPPAAQPTPREPAIMSHPPFQKLAPGSSGRTTRGPPGPQNCYGSHVPC